MAFDGDIIALDVSSSRTGIARGRPGQIPVLTSQEFTGLGQGVTADHTMAFGQCLRWCAAEFAIKPALVVLEAPLVRSGDKDGQNRAILLLGLTAVVRSAANSRSIRCELAHVGTWRKYMLGNGNLPGADAKRRAMAICKQIGMPAKNHDEAEACGVWLWACGKFAKQHDDRLLPLLAKARLQAA
ncbi:hypothetical protein [Labrys sp. ZIDIC5]|uniref:hypothetical protein n=1 Tax=Labrys sedimenti TaxID=3106036 RepID=UPI002ACA7E59|nr:hypothetical protein [Labrys sp. ZIDIC5]MDZ5448909.1 hypothetical protein [Labrys sp. ZIDIC5]